MNPWLILGILGAIGIIGYKSVQANASAAADNASAAQAMNPIFTAQAPYSSGAIGSGGVNAGYANMTVGDLGTVAGGYNSAVQSMTASTLAAGGLQDATTVNATLASNQTTALDNTQGSSGVSDTNTAVSGTVINTGTTANQAVTGTDSGNQMLSLLQTMYQGQQTTNQQIIAAQQHSDELASKNQTLMTSSMMAASFLDQNSQAAKAFGVTVNPTSSGGFDMFAITDKTVAADVLAPNSAVAKNAQFSQTVSQAKTLAGLNEVQLGAIGSLQAGTPGNLQASTMAQPVLTAKQKAAADAAAKKAAAAQAASDKKAAAAKAAADKAAAAKAAAQAKAAAAAKLKADAAAAKAKKK